MAKLPMQPLHRDSHGTIRFVENRIVRDLYDAAKAAGVMDMNSICIDAHKGKYTDQEQMQFAQLIGYSLCGFEELSYASDEVVNQAHQSYLNSKDD